MSVIKTSHIRTTLFTPQDVFLSGYLRKKDIYLFGCAF